MGYREEVYKDGVLITVHDDRVLTEEQAIKVAEVKEKAGELLSKTDWMVTRATEAGYGIDAATTATRKAIRDSSNVAEQKILGFTELLQLDRYHWFKEFPEG